MWIARSCDLQPTKRKDPGQGIGRTMPRLLSCSVSGGGCSGEPGAHSWAIPGGTDGRGAGTRRRAMGAPPPPRTPAAVDPPATTPVHRATFHGGRGCKHSCPTAAAEAQPKLTPSASQCDCSGGGPGEAGAIRPPEWEGGLVPAARQQYDAVAQLTAPCLSSSPPSLLSFVPGQS